MFGEVLEAVGLAVANLAETNEVYGGSRKVFARGRLKPAKTIDSPARNLVSR